MNAGILFGSEIVILNNERFNKYGIGVNYQLNNSFINIKGSYNFWPLYIFSRYKVFDTDYFNLNLQLNIGFNIINVSTDYLTENGETKGGLYYSFGTVAVVNNSIHMRIVYSTNYGKLKLLDKNLLVKNSFFSWFRLQFLNALNIFNK